MIDAEFKSEERYSRLSIAFCEKEEKEQIVAKVESIAKKYPLTPDIHFAEVSNGKTVMVLEYHDDVDREAGAIFEEIVKELNIDHCD